MFLDSDKYYKDLSGSYHPKNEVYNLAYNVAIISCRNKVGVELIESLISVNAQVAHLLLGDERDTFHGMLDGLDVGTSGGLING